MADDQSGGQGTPVPEQDATKNVKAEFDRKLQAINDQIAAQNQFYAEQFNNIQNLIKETKAPASSVDSDKELEKMYYDEPAKFTKTVTDRATRAAEDAANRIASAQAERQTLLTQMVAEYPELNDTTSEMYQKVMVESKKLSKDEQANNLIIKGLIHATAADTGILPKSKRATSGSDGFSLGGSRGSGSGTPRKSGDTQIDDKTLLFSQLLGRDVNDPKVRKGLEAAVKRDTYNKYR